MNFQEMGDALRKERERKGLTIELVMEATKISRTNIVAMESGDKAALPHPVYAKGFVKSYARYLGLDSDEMAMVVDREYQDEADGPEEKIYEVSPAAEKAFQEGDSPEVKRRSIWPLVLVLVVLVGVVVLLVMNFKAKNDNEIASSAPAIEQVDEVDVPDSPIAENEAYEVESSQEDAQVDSVVEGTTVKDGEVVEDEVSQVEDSAESEMPQAASEVEIESAAGSQSESQPELSAITPDESTPEVTRQEKQKYDHMLVIRATTEKGCWIGVWRGDETKMARDFVLKQGEPLRLMFNSPRRIRIGNVAGVTVTYNGTPYALDNTQGNIQTLRFGME
ncbi:helix-turn-helix domain-containing protein [Pseudodesulfovibrio sp. zrk46]|uniref:helix-turn-helix domain-containing protein n=1 Tax=Pseudodesulfovibrio sp. zrk46 TaxID=2725288 RepID=UPI00144A1859|nr:helix-turn-helix domain-containing protein [Pseudodesulfovibrio sp. zrk46]QJB57809.1 DUF4115 domain-containing protein [Pseudodesulfovibrio sp. zrk46]